jgi:hypothetical protein
VFTGADRVSLGRVVPGRLRPPLARMLRAGPRAAQVPAPRPKPGAVAPIAQMDDVTDAPVGPPA